MEDIRFTIPKKSADWLVEYPLTSDRVKQHLQNALVMPYGAGHQVILMNPTVEQIEGLRFALEQAFIHWDKKCKELPNNTSRLKNKNTVYAEAISHRRKYSKLLDLMDDWPGIHYVPVGNPI